MKLYLNYIELNYIYINNENNNAVQKQIFLNEI